MVGSVLAAAFGLLAAYWIYIRHWGLAARMTKSARWLYDLLDNKYYVDKAYMEAVVKPLRSLAAFLSDKVEDKGIDAAVEGLARLVGLAGEGVRRLQTGRVRNYGLAMLVGAVAVLAYVLARSLWGW